MDEQDKNIVSFENPVEEPEPLRTVEIEYPKTVVDEPAHAAPAGPSHSKPKEKKYVTKGALIACMILTMILSSLLGAFISGAYFSRTTSDGRATRNDSQLSQLDLGDATGSDLTVAQIVDRNENAVVEILMSGTQQNMWGQMQLVQGAGSGVIVREDGYIATNYHVIQGANKVEVTLHNGDSYSAHIIGSDPANDIAVIKIDAKGLTTATVGDSSTVDVGDLAVAIGNPLGQLGGTATTGIISALDRTLDVEGTTLTLMQTDAAINGGNSGGGLFNSKGELIGIVESKASAVGVEGLAFALPINTVSPIINDFIENGGNVQAAEATPAVGVVISDVSEENAQYYGLESAGVYVAQVTGENAQKAGFQAEDRIVSFNGKQISDSNEFITLVRKCKVGDTVTIVVSRKGQQIEIKTVLEELQQQQP
ncbi:MAG: trypsin-like peptidase domain-containing protein [Mogibacterium sp.]|nr:trypsin-like peptidase domain-containing protein [Mogibacterium sp.]MBR4090833.1 trypsin-like peptidase domain-containing protein [Mogibacterium sp.]